MEFAEKVYNVLKRIPCGKVVTYKWVACQIGCPFGSRAVGQVLKSNPKLIEVPCHRVICSDGSVGGYVKGVEEKVCLLKKEGVEVVDGKVDLEKFGINFSSK